MILAERIENLTSSNEEYDDLYNSDNIYIVRATKLDDKKLEDFINAVGVEYSQFRKSLRASKEPKDKKSYLKIENNDNKEDSLYGYIYGVNDSNADDFEKNALMPSMKYSYRFEKLNMNDIKKKEKEEIFNKLAEEE